MNTGSLIITTEELGASFSQYYNLAKPLGLSKNTIKFLRGWTVKCEHCGKSFSPKPHPERKNASIRCLECRQLWRREKERFRKQLKLNIDSNSFRKSFILFKPTGSHIV